ncbi:MAG: hypothetical protein DI586_03605 [Micavibrio aeruginosavorus]|uniref:N-acetyltransferase domain-containing protein n=1 Tax=Micavibrio aeruginosavorus TaxID=349221 RepID=A0A2W5FND1_9BACT|nr:MAG: hypothetical protein DI586_03605 [Micavibrio aeruginosavorus]
MFTNSAAISSDSTFYLEPAPVSLKKNFLRVAGPEFCSKILQYRHDNPHRCEDISVFENYEQAECWVQNNGEAGFAIMPGFELVNLFSRKAGLGSQALKFAQENYNCINLNCHVGKLEKFYTSHGFQVTRQEENWFTTPEKKLPPVVYMSWAGYSQP